jgi:NADPH-dependent curcumin reductase CurA
MTEKIARQIVLAARPHGRPKPSDFRLEETAIPAPSSGQVLLRVQYLSLDPYMRGRMDDRKSYAKPVPLGGVMEGESVATVIASQHPAYSEGDTVLARTGWRTHALSVARTCASSTRRSRRLRRDSAYSGCPGSPRIAACA